MTVGQLYLDCSLASDLDAARGRKVSWMALEWPSEEIFDWALCVWSWWSSWLPSLTEWLRSLHVLEIKAMRRKRTHLLERAIWRNDDARSHAAGVEQDFIDSDEREPLLHSLSSSDWSLWYSISCLGEANDIRCSWSLSLRCYSLFACEWNSFSTRRCNSVVESEEEFWKVVKVEEQRRLWLQDSDA